ncbi:MAG: Hsp20/alpha crystallin family protein [Candidatus Competibacteraceae bacterium]|nr:Hsp20/alpha crystallin family protein [Candidatus Competibacteraceae bacterium]
MNDETQRNDQQPAETGQAEETATQGSTEPPAPESRQQQKTAPQVRELVPDQQSQQGLTARMMDPFEAMVQMLENMIESLTSPVRWQRPSLRMPGMSSVNSLIKLPRVDVVERDQELIVRAEVPGTEKKNLEVMATNDAITLKGITTREKKEETGQYHRQEITLGSFSRTIPLPCEVDGTAAKATFRNGLLEVTLPKLTRAGGHRIDIS